MVFFYDNTDKIPPLSKEDLDKIRFDFEEELSKRLHWSGEPEDNLPPIEETEAYRKFIAAGLSL